MVPETSVQKNDVHAARSSSTAEGSVQLCFTCVDASSGHSRRPATMQLELLSTSDPRAGWVVSTRLCSKTTCNRLALVMLSSSSTYARVLGSVT